jgi:type II secretory pathway pseudopilin PulG
VAVTGYTSTPLRGSNSAAAGFSLVEVMLAATLLVIVAIGATILFTLSNQQTLSSRGKQEQQSAISEDLAALLRMNDRYSCISGSCAVASSDPGEDEYYPSASTSQQSFNNSCSSGGLLSNLITAINGRAAPAAFNTLGIQRQAPVIDSEEPSTHRYSITWVDASGRRLRQVTLVPTVANWCP